MLKVAGGIILAIVLLVVVAPICCTMCAVGVGSAALESDKQEKQAKKAKKVQKARAASPTGKVVTYGSNCNVRAKPKANARKIARARAGRPYPVLTASGKWRQIKVGSKIGWAGCTDRR